MEKVDHNFASTEISFLLLPMRVISIWLHYFGYVEWLLLCHCQQCDQNFFNKYSTFYVQQWTFAKVGSKFPQMLNRPSKIAKKDHAECQQ